MFQHKQLAAEKGLDSLTFQVRRRHEFSLLNADGMKQSFYVDKFCDTTSGKRVYFVANANNQLAVDDVVCKHFL